MGPELGVLLAPLAGRRGACAGWLRAPVASSFGPTSIGWFHWPGVGGWTVVWGIGQTPSPCPRQARGVCRPDSTPVAGCPVSAAAGRERALARSALGFLGRVRHGCGWHPVRGAGRSCREGSAASLLLGLCEAVGVGAGLDNVRVERDRSTIAVQRRGSVNVCFHSENGALEATAIAPLSSRSVKIWNRSFAPDLSRSR